ncbi:hypothetical protein MHYP_G00294340 [Metynnis hypsauchen]
MVFILVDRCAPSPVALLGPPLPLFSFESNNSTDHYCPILHKDSACTVTHPLTLLKTSGSVSPAALQCM